MLKLELELELEVELLISSWDSLMKTWSSNLNHIELSHALIPSVLCIHITIDLYSNQLFNTCNFNLKNIKKCMCVYVCGDGYTGIRDRW